MQKLLLKWAWFGVVCVLSSMPCRCVEHAKYCRLYWWNILEPRPPRAPRTAHGCPGCRPLAGRLCAVLVTPSGARSVSLLSLPPPLPPSSCFSRLRVSHAPSSSWNHPAFVLSIPVSLPRPCSYPGRQGPLGWGEGSCFSLKASAFLCLFSPSLFPSKSNFNYIISHQYFFTGREEGKIYKTQYNFP